MIVPTEERSGANRIGFAALQERMLSAKIKNPLKSTLYRMFCNVPGVWNTIFRL